MMRASATNQTTGRAVMILGLEERNIIEMRKGHPIHIHADELGFKGEIVICLGETGESLREQIEPIYLTVGERIARRRRKCGITQRELGAAVGVTDSAISHIEAGRHGLSVDTLLSMAQCLGTSGSVLLRGL